MKHLRIPLTPEDHFHLVWRTGFGPAAGTSAGKISRQAAIDQVFKSARKWTPLKMFDRPLQEKVKMKDLSRKERQELRKQRREEIQQLGVAWLEKMARDSAQLQEKMTFFWHDHFAARVERPAALQDFNNLMRRHALGNFRTLLLGVAQHPVMLDYLDGRKNKKAHPNENFARELMELFTLGVGNYSELDIKEAARAFTGWNFDQQGNFVVRKNHHDNGTKTFRGSTGNFNGEDVIDLILSDKQTARYICQKLYCYFVHPEPHLTRIEQLATVFYDGNYQIEPVMRALLESEWFWEKNNRGVRIKSPVDLLAGMQRNVGMEYPEPKGTFQILRLLGQVPFDPPNVAGWPSGKSWIDAGTLTARMTLPVLALFQRGQAFQANPDLMMGEQSPPKMKKFRAEMDWNKWGQQIKGKDTLAMVEELRQHLLPFAEGNFEQKLPRSPMLGSDRATQLQQLTLSFLQLPEYQLS